MKKKGRSYGAVRKGRVKVILTPLGDRIKYRIVGRVYCTRMSEELSNSGTYSKDDGVWRWVFRSPAALRRFLKRNRSIARILSLYDLGYDSCDQLVPPGKQERPLGTGSAYSRE